MSLSYRLRVLYSTLCNCLTKNLQTYHHFCITTVQSIMEDSFRATVQFVDSRKELCILNYYMSLN